MQNFETVTVETDLLILGGGMAACGAAVEAAFREVERYEEVLSNWSDSTPGSGSARRRRAAPGRPSADPGGSGGRDPQVGHVVGDEDEFAIMIDRHQTPPTTNFHYGDTESTKKFS